MYQIKILEHSICDVCGNEGNAHGYGEEGILLCSNLCNSLYEHKLIDLDFIKKCSLKLKREMREINKKVKDNSHEYTQLYIDILKIIYKEIYGKREYRYYCKEIKEKLESFSYGNEKYDVSFEFLKEEKRTKIKRQISELETERMKLWLELKKI